MITLFAKWNSVDVGKAVDAVNRISKPSKLIAIALRARTMAARFAAVDKLDHQGLIKVAGDCGAVLKSIAAVQEKDACAELMIFIYNSTRSREIRDKIQSYAGIVIENGQAHSDYEAHTDAKDTIECANCPCSSEEHTDYKAHTDIAARAAKRFFIP